ncbi:hypothetical protein FE257_012531 [Aspergillus nanangensis]|uniref:Uncharacterized protein n=1 Tax=Aspergillus nanangensis TaxID=2582783 RepID=A0AAD4CUT0_ASPNN|nr:hypothetical protein FE257_012531 [Aspergillus nanangensis]
MSQFQLFPSVSPRTKASKNPFRREYKAPAVSVQSSISVPLEDFKSEKAKAEAVIVQVIEPSSIKRPTKVHLARSASGSPKPDTPESRTMHSPPNAQSEQWSSPLSEIDSKSLLRSDSPATTVESAVSPVIPMRSMFPRYDPNKPLNQQNYYPQPAPATETRRPKPPQLTIVPPPEIDQSLGPKTVPASVMNFPSIPAARYSSAEELKNLWEAANGQRPQGLAGVYNLRVARTDSATFTFGDPKSPFYTVQTYSTDELSIQRANPTNPKSNVPIMTLKLEDRRRRELPNDGRVTQLFSRLAAMLAIDEAKELAKHHLLDSGEAAEVEANALKRAAAHESCRLSWNHAKQVYELRHPSFSKQYHQQQPLIGAAGVPLSPLQSKYSGLLHISVSSPSSTDEYGNAARQPPAIIVTTPSPANAVDSANVTATPRTSTLPMTDTDEPLASLDLATMTLSVSAAAITATIPSLYAIDSVVSAMFAVAVSDTLTNPILAEMDLYHPYEHQPPYVVGGGAHFTGNLVATVAERDDARQGMQLVSKIRSKAEESLQKRRSWFRFWGSSSKSAEPRRTGKGKGSGGSSQVVVEEFDLERYGHYGGSSSREGEKLPGVTRSVIKVLFWGLRLVVKGLTLLVKILAWTLVTLTRCATSDKL